MTFGIQPIHIVIILLVALLIFGPKRLPEIGRNIGKAINEFRHGTREITESFREEVNQPLDSQTTNHGSMAGISNPDPTRSFSIQTPSLALAQPGNFCIQCGAPNMPEARFCNQCGKKLPKKVIQPSGPSEPS
jgi:sec-independent protein translocase protein TatA